MGGADKALCPLAGRPLIAHVLDRLEPQVERVLISANGDPSRFAGLGCPVVAGCRAARPALRHPCGSDARPARLGATHVVSTPVDTPFLPGDLVAAACCWPPKLRPTGWRWPRTADGDHPATRALAGRPCALPWRHSLAEGEAKVTRFHRRPSRRARRLSRRPAFLNLNTPEDLAAGRSPAERCAMKVYGVIGWKNSGKTSLMERLVAEITGRGLLGLDRQACASRGRP